MTATWADLDRDRWAWAVSARAELRARLAGLADPGDVPSLAHVMLVGDTQAGKTTVLLRLLGVSNGAVDQCARVLRAGREHGRSATATPIRYCWSGDPDRWLLIQGREQADRIPQLVTAEELMVRLADYRSPSGDQLRWHVGDPPLEIGIPNTMAGNGRQPALRILDMPGLYTESHQEDQAARQLTARAAPSMSLIVFVQPANKMADAMQDPAITKNPHLACWHSATARFRIVLTYAFSAESIRKLLTAQFGTTSWDPHTVATWLRGHVVEQLTQSAAAGADREALKKIVFPVEVGDSRKNMASHDPCYAANALPANDLLLTELCETLQEGASEDAVHLSAPILGRHIMSLVQQKGEERKRRLDRLARARAAAQQHVATARATQQKLLDRRDQLAHEAGRIRAAAAALAASQPAVHRPDKPEMKGPAVRKSQEDDRGALMQAARDLWDAWWGPEVSESFPSTLPPDFEHRLRARYDEVASCCRECSNTPPARWTHGRPDRCYAKMTRAVEDVQSWITAALSAHIEPAVSQASGRLAEATTRCERATRLLATYRQALLDAAAAFGEQQRNAAQQEHYDEQERTIAHQVLKVHDRHNERYVRELAARAENATPDERGLLAAAALRAVYDLGRMYGRA